MFSLLSIIDVLIVDVFAEFPPVTGLDSVDVTDLPLQRVQKSSGESWKCS